MNSITILLAAILLATTITANVLPIPESRIVGGTAARAGQYPYAASLQLGGNRHFCGAAIIRARWVLTAASCVFEHFPGSFTVRTGTHQFATGGITHQVAQIIVHPKYAHDWRNNDIALVQTVSTIANNQNSQPIPLPTQNQGAGNAVVVGWGRSDPSGPNMPVLQVLKTQTMTFEQCRTGLKLVGQQAFLRQTNICTQTSAGGVCRGDSGTPLTVNGQLAGVLSFGMSCAVGSPDVFTRVHSYLAWINQNSN